MEKKYSEWEIIFPRKKAICLDAKIPLEIKNDLNNANSIIDISPDAAANLARRALERMLRKYLDLKGKDLEELIMNSAPLLPKTIFKILDGVRGFGNFGAHLKEDFASGELLLVEKEPAVFVIGAVRKVVEFWFVEKSGEDEMLNHLAKMKERSKRI